MKKLLLALVMMLPAGLFAQSGAEAPWVAMNFLNAQGVPLAGGKVCTYAAGTTTPLVTYSDYLITTPNANPTLLDAQGRPTTGAIYLSAAQYKFVLRTAGTTNDCTTGTVVWTADHVYDLALLFTLNFATKIDDGIRHCSQYPGSDAGAKIQAAINDLPSVGGTVDCRGIQGAQTISATITVAKAADILLGSAVFTFTGSTKVFNFTSSNVTLEGTDPTLTKINAPTGVRIVDPTNGSQIRSITFAGSGTTSSGANCIDGAAGSIANVIIENNVIEECGDAGIFAGAVATHWTIRSNVVRNNSSQGIALGSNSADNLIESNEILANGSNGIALSGTTRTTVVHNNIQANGGSSSEPFGVYITAAAGDSTYNIVCNNTLLGHSGAAVDVAAAAGFTAAFNLICDNTMLAQQTTSGHGVAFGPGSSGGTITNNSATGNIISANAGDGVFMSAASVGLFSINSVTNNRIFGNSLYGVLIGSGVINSDVSANYVVNNLTGQISDGATDGANLGCNKLSQMDTCNFVRLANLFAGMDASSKIIEAIGDLPTGIGGTVDARGLEGAQVWTSCPFSASADPYTLILGGGVTTVNVDCVATDNVNLDFDQSAVISPISTKTFTISGAANLTMRRHFQGAGTVLFNSIYVPDIFPEWWGAKADGSTDSTPGLAAALASVVYHADASGNFNGGSVRLNNGTYAINDTLLIRTGTWLHGTAYSNIVNPPTKILSIVAKPIISPYDVTRTAAVTISDLGFQGVESDSRSAGILSTTKSDQWVLRDLFFSGFGGPAVDMQSGAALKMFNVVAQRSLMDIASWVAIKGVFDIGLTDATVDSVEATASVGSPFAQGLWGAGTIWAIVMRGAQGTLTNSIGEYSQGGIAVLGDGCRLTNDRGDNNQGPGFLFSGGVGQYTNLESYSNSRDADGEFPGFLVHEANNRFTNIAAWDADDLSHMSVAVVDDTNTTTDNNKSNSYVDAHSLNLIQNDPPYVFTGNTKKTWSAGWGQAWKTSLAFEAPHVVGAGGTPTMTGSAGCTGGTKAITGTDLSGTINMTTGTACPNTHQQVVHIVFAVPFDAVPRGIAVTPGNAAASILAVTSKPYVEQSTVNTTGFEIITGSTGLADSTGYVWEYTILGNAQ